MGRTQVAHEHCRISHIVGEVLVAGLPGPFGGDPS
jgi:hypothetical protein